MYKLFLFFVIAVYSAKANTLGGSERIMGGAYRTDINYVISLQDKRQSQANERGHICGGVLINRQFALTTASCVLENNGQSINITNFRVFAGTVLTNDNANSVRDISSITVHPNYNRQNPLVNNIAVITLQSAFPESIIPLSMPSADVTHPATCETSGFGARNSTATASAQLITLSPVVTMPLELCRLVEPQVQSGVVCASGGGAGCAGDIGNPLVCGTQSSPILCGLLSRSNNCGVIIDGTASATELYTRVFEFAPWVNGVVNSAPGAAATSQLGIALAFMFVVIQNFNFLH
ncbi:hypothetical protein HW555_008309 [Spodoptera exigua]|uniref:Peptidase S1 domain-containing protein n=1 Tax=Spodoptera exigua TaxID=7107 RepID=A0A835GDA2_SPOEX|nr:hypothetical protein HW555_008309 [Spodoptera exigua]